MHGGMPHVLGVGDSCASSWPVSLWSEAFSGEDLTPHDASQILVLHTVRFAEGVRRDERAKPRLPAHVVRLGHQSLNIPGGLGCDAFVSFRRQLEARK